ncbi:hypothetical protein [Oceanobacillus profundus]|uniref:hypothetical protein n=1 Tax=Oceanobacillus TaxID=182709 RepID=UPI0026E43846|nr:hypothetical protein [Oceanobacillus profundus]MBR3120398.1 hypothetical protein [Oceanobacillus sp.]MDO6450951.1 hypothetical protein [Oceanobacillus profundus]
MKIHHSLIKIGEQLDEKNLEWALGGSLLLNHYRIADSPNDIDLLIAEKDIDPIRYAMSRVGKEKTASRKDPFRTTYFYQYEVDGVGVDVMGNFAIEHDQGIYQLVFDANHIVGRKNIQGVSIPLAALEDWFVLYQLIPNKQEKAKRIEKYLQSNPVTRPDLLHKAMEQPLPFKVRESINAILRR